MPSWTAFRTCRTCRKEARQVPVRQVLASYFANFQHLSIIPLQQPVRRLTGTDFQHLTSIWETFGKHYEHVLHILHPISSKYPTIFAEVKEMFIIE
jgi:hypothetical protein